MKVLRRFSPIIEVFSIDEAFLDITYWVTTWHYSPTDIGKMIKEKMKKVPGQVYIAGSKFRRFGHQRKTNSYTNDGYTIYYFARNLVKRQVEKGSLPGSFTLRNNEKGIYTYSTIQQ